MDQADARPDELAGAATALLFAAPHAPSMPQFETVPIAGHEHHHHFRTLRRRRSTAGTHALASDVDVTAGTKGGDEDAA